MAFSFKRTKRVVFPQYLCTYNQFGLLGGPSAKMMNRKRVHDQHEVSQKGNTSRETEEGLFLEDYVFEFRRNSVFLMDVNWMHCQTIKLSLLSSMLWLIMCKLLDLTIWQVCICVYCS